MAPFSSTHPLLLLLLLLFLTSAATAAGKRFHVGDHQGWHQPAPNDTAFYSRWAAANRFHVGDFIYFRYTNDSVWVVNKAGYYHCNTTIPAEKFTGGETVYALKRPGPYYFVSGDVGHCRNGERLVVDVKKARPHAPEKLPPAPAPAPETTGYVQKSPPPTTPPTPATPPTSVLSAPPPDASSGPAGAPESAAFGPSAWPPEFNGGGWSASVPAVGGLVAVAVAVVSSSWAY